jgi:uncharacterized integral membrane protein
MRILFAVLAVLAVSFALSNRQSVELAWWPLPDTLSLPLYVVVLVLLLTGYLAGRAGGWLAHRGVRRERRDAARRADALAAELASSRAAAPAAGAGSTRSLVAGPPAR